MSKDGKVTTQNCPYCNAQQSTTVTSYFTIHGLASLFFLKSQSNLAKLKKFVIDNIND